jgi:tetratricopeptide (TPR) repeat protein
MNKKVETLVDDDGRLEKLIFSIPSQEELKRKGIEFQRFSERTLSKHPEYKGAVDLRERKLFDEAIEIHKEILSKDPDFFPSLYELGIIFNDINDYAKAVEYLKKAEKHCTHPIILRHMSLTMASAEKELGDSLIRTNSTLALSHYTNADELYRKNLGKGSFPVDEYLIAVINYGNLCCSLRKNSRAHDLYLHAMKIIEGNPELKRFESIVKKYLKDTEQRSI